MKHQILLFIFLFSCGFIFAEDNSISDSLKIDSLKNEISVLNQKITDVNERLKYQADQINGQSGMLDTAFDGVSASLSASSNFIGIFGIIIAIFSIGLSIYVARIEKNVKAMKIDNEFLLQKNIQIKLDLEGLSDKITKDTKGLYKLIRNEESNQMLDRLVSVPEDIQNLFSNLASRDLEKEHFVKLKEAFMQLNEKDEGYSEYLILFFEHFSDLSYIDNEIRPKFLNSLSNNFYNAFKNDVIKSVSDFFSAILQATISSNIKEINQYVDAFCKSSFADTEDIYFTINNVMQTRDNKFELYDSISKASELLIFRKNFGKLILDYNFENLTPKELALIQDINYIITA